MLKIILLSAVLSLTFSFSSSLENTPDSNNELELVYSW